MPPDDKWQGTIAEVPATYFTPNLHIQLSPFIS